MKTYFIILTHVCGNKYFDACSDEFENYPSEEEVREEMERLEHDGFEVYSARVEKRYKLIK